MSYFGSRSKTDCQFIGKRCSILRGSMKGTIIDSTYEDPCDIFFVKFDNGASMQVFYQDIMIDGWDINNFEFTDDPKYKV